MSGIEEQGGAKQNRLAQETSPYLLQHAANPVDWYPWGPEALARAKREDRPILLSIGYSACHWCHVMERESFCSEDIAAVMNDHFVCIKVDREERPDLDEIYMAATIAMSGSGGWPMTVFLTPDQEPFFAGTYFPPEDGYGRPGFRSLLERIAELWRARREQLVHQAASLVEHVRDRARPAAPQGVTQAAIDEAVARLGASFDSAHGGFSGAPKFPAPLSLELLLRHHRRTGDERALAMVTTTLDAMARGGIRDHLGGGFARYSTDEQWLVPHFEKMLYDNAALARIYAQAFQVTGEAAYRRVARESLDWVVREMQSSAGGFYCSTDADSEGVEGKYFVWSPEELSAVLSAAEASAFGALYDVTEAGNWEGRSILHTPRSARDVALEVGCSVAVLEERIEAARPKLLAERAKRVPPACDDKVLTAWNGLMIGSLAECGRIFDDESYIAAARRAAVFVWDELRQTDRRLARTHRAGQARHDAVLEDYAYLADGLLDLYEAGGEARWLRWADELGRRMLTDFGDDQHGGFYATGSHHEPLLVRIRDGQDGALPNANAVTARVLARLSFIEDDPALRQRAVDAIAAYGRLIERAPEAFTGSLRVVDLLLEGPVEVILVGAKDSRRAGALRRELGRHYLPNRTIVHADPHDDVGDPAPVAAALLEGRGLIDGQPAAYVCRDFACRAPVTDPAELGEALADDRQRATSGRGRSVSASVIEGAASVAGTKRYADARGPDRCEAGYRQLGRTSLWASRVGFGGYRVDERAPGHGKALRQALLGGCNLVDTSTNYTDGDSERLVGSALRELTGSGELARDEIIVVSKIGYVQGRNLELARQRQEAGEPFEQMVRYTDECWHCIHPSFLADQLTRSLERLGLATLDVCLLHNPEYFLSEAARRGVDDLESLRTEFYQRIERAFAFFEGEVREGRIRHYGVSSNTVAAAPGDTERTDLFRMLAAAERAGGSEHHFAVLQLPVNLIESQAALAGAASNGSDQATPSLLESAHAAGLGVLVNRPLNAFGRGGLVRLAEPSAGEQAVADPDSFGAAIERLAELEAEFAASFASMLQGVATGRAQQLLRWEPQIRKLDHELSNNDQLGSIAYGQVLPRTAQVLAAVEQSLSGQPQAAFSAWQKPYLQALEGCFAALRGQILQRGTDEAEAIARQIDPLLDEARRTEPLSRKALWVLQSTPGIDVVLLGMRRPAYVDDAMPVMTWPPLGDVDGVYRVLA